MDQNNPTHPDLWLLLERLKAGDRKVIKDYVDLYYQPMLFLVNAFVRNTPLAKEIVQNGFVKLYTASNREKLSTPGHVKGFLFKVVKNESIDYIRGSQLR